MVKRLLVTTALEETWGQDTAVFFLGEWCKLHARKEKWEAIENSVCPYHWDDRNKLFKDYQYLTELHERLLCDLAIQLNKIHNIDFNVRAWRILAGPWLGYFTQILFDRWCMIQYAGQSDQQLKTVILEGKEGSMVPYDMNHFYTFFLNDEWNYFIYSCILAEFPCIEQLKSPWLTNTSPNHNTAAYTSKKNLRQKIIQIYNKVACFLNGKNALLLINTYLSWKNYINLSFRFKQLPVLEGLDKPVNAVVNTTERKWVLKGESYSSFEVFARKIIPQQIPVAYLEGFMELYARAEKMNWPAHPKVIFTAISFNANDVFKMYAARHIQKSTALVIGQHGGHYGIGKWFFNEEHEIAISDKFLSWGWIKSNEPRVVKVGQLKSKKPKGISHSTQTELLLVTATLPRYSYFMYSIMVSSQWLNYFNQQCEFVDKLSGSIRHKVTVRLYKNDFGWNQLHRWKERFPELNYDEGQINIDEHITKSRLFVSTYNATSYLESFTMNIPTVIFWDPGYTEIRDSAIPYFEDLKRVGVFHETPESAANHINEIWNDVDTWWNSVEVRNVVNRFTRNFCDLSDQLVDNVEKELRELLDRTELFN